MRAQSGARFAALAMLLAVLAAPSGSRAQRLVWLAPSRAPAGRLTVALTEIDASGLARAPVAATIDARGGVLVEQAPRAEARVFSLDAESGELRLSARAAGAEAATAALRIGAPAARVALAAEPAAPVKNQDQTATLRITVLRGDGSPDPEAPPPVVRTNVGTIEDLAAVSGGRFVARYRLPKARYPEVAILVAFVPWPHADSVAGAFGVLALPLASKVTLPGRTEPDASVRLDIAGTSFGPVRSDAEGNFEIPIVVPPGHRFGTTLATDRAGNRRSKNVDLHLPPTDRIACVANPTSLPADGAARARILCAATDPFGAPVAGARLLERAQWGALEGPRALSDGVYEWSYVAPKSLPASGEDPLVFEFPAGGKESREALALRLLPPPPARVEVEVVPQPIFVGASGTVRLQVRDRDGRPVPARPELRAQRGRLGAFAAPTVGEYLASYRPPAEPGDWTDRIAGPIFAPVGEVPARLSATLDGQTVVAEVESLGGLPIEGAAVTLDGRAAVTGPGGLARFPLGPEGDPVQRRRLVLRERPSLQAELWVLKTAAGPRLFPDAGPLGPIPLEAKIALAPPTPVDLRVELVPPSGAEHGAVRYRVFDLEGRPLRGRAVNVAVESADGRAIATGPAAQEPDGAVRLPLRERVHGTVRASATDTSSGVSAAQEASWP